jgi:hypothetical protein
MTKPKLLFCLLMIAAISSLPLAAQTAEIMDRIIATPAISVSQAAYLVFVASGKLAEDASPDQAFTLFEEMNWIDAHGDPGRALKASEYAYLLTRSYGLTGGLLSSLLAGPRYAYRDMVFRGLFAARGDPDEPLTGVEAVRILGKVMDSLPQGGRS